jgi:hypothetical protein
MAYTTATLIQKDPAGPDDRVRLVIQFTGTGEAAKNLEYYVDGATTGLAIRRWAIDIAAKLDGRKTIADNLTVGQSINLAAIAPTPPTAKQVWLEKVGRYRYFSGLGLTGAANTALAALLTDINATYAAGFLDA